MMRSISVNSCMLQCSVFQPFCCSGTPHKREEWSSHFTEPHALIHQSSDVREVEVTGCLQTHFSSRAEAPWDDKEGKDDQL